MGVWCIHHFRRLTSIAIIFTTSQGFFIFIFFCVIVKEGRELWINLLCCGRKLPSTPLYKNSGGEVSTGMRNNPMKLLKLSSMYFHSPSTTSSMQNDKTHVRIPLLLLCKSKVVEEQNDIRIFYRMHKRDYRYPFSAHALEGRTNFYSNKVYNLVIHTAHGEPSAITQSL